MKQEQKMELNMIILLNKLVLSLVLLGAVILNPLYCSGLWLSPAALDALMRY